MIARRDFIVRTAGLAAFGMVGGCPPSTAGPEPKATPFDLEIKITGLCMLVPSPSNTKMHVLMVAPAKEDADYEPHYPRVFYDAAHDCQVARGKYWRAVPLEKMVLDLSGFPSGDSGFGSIPDIKAIKNLVDLRPYAPSLNDVEVTTPHNLGARLTLPPGLVDTPDARGPWKLVAPSPLPTTDLPLAAWYVIWTVKGIVGSELPWTLAPFKDDHVTPEPLAPLKPIGGGSGANPKISLLISNTVRRESSHELQGGPAPTPKTPMPHFHAFADLYDKPGPWPDLIYEGQPAGPGGTPYTCLPSGGH